MKYYFFLDESGDHSLKNINKDFPIFVLCGIVISEYELNKLNQSFNEIKRNFWGGEEIVFHSNEIRKHKNNFIIFRNDDIRSRFYYEINTAIKNTDFKIISSAIDKTKYKKQSNVYEIALSFIIERAVFYLDSIRAENKCLKMIIERRGKKEDKKLKDYLGELKRNGTRYVLPGRINNYFKSYGFHLKSENINGLQLADMAAYPIARHCLNGSKPNIAFDVIKTKFYSNGSKRYGLKVFP